jgi:hypothetical protein
VQRSFWEVVELLVTGVAFGLIDLRQCRYREVMASVQAEALAAARTEVLAARREPGVDPEAADRVLRRLDLRTVLLD